MFKKIVFISVFAVLGIGTTYANNTAVTYTLPSAKCKTFVGSWVGKKTFHFNTKEREGGMLTVEDKSKVKAIRLPSSAYVSGQGNLEYVGETYNGRGYDFTYNHVALTLSSPSYRQYKFEFCNAEW